MKRIGVIMHGITGRMGYNQHLVRSVLAIRDQGGVLLKNGERVMLDPILVGRNGAKIEEIAKKHNVARWTTDIDAALANPDDTLFFDAGTTQMRGSLLEKAIKAGKNVYCEKPISDTMDEALADAAPKIWPDAPSNAVFDWQVGDADGAAAGIAKAAHVTRLRIVQNRVAPTSMDFSARMMRASNACCRMRGQAWAAATGGSSATISRLGKS